MYDDRWALGGDSPGDMTTATERIFEQYTHFEGRPLAVRGDTLQLATSHWSNDDGYETSYLHVTEIDDDGLITYYGRFGDDDFDGAYRELERRYYAERVRRSQNPVHATEYSVALNQQRL